MRGERSTKAISGSRPRVKKIWLVAASTPFEASFETTPQAPQTAIVSSEKKSQRGRPAIVGLTVPEACRAGVDMGRGEGVSIAGTNCADNPRPPGKPSVF